MDCVNVVFNAARDGKLRRLRVFLDHRTKEEVRQLVSAKSNGATPLVVACRNGHLEVVEYLSDRCNADIEQPGSVIFDGETIEGAPPLWCASAAGHLTVVKHLVKRGAKVNSTTRTNSTPLRAACFDGHYDIVKYLVENDADIEVANRHGHTCLMIACYKGHFRIAKYLVDIRADVNRKSIKGNTALHDCAESGSLEILKLLLAHGAKMDVDSYGMTPLLAAAVTGHAHIVEYLLEFPGFVKIKERIDALELLGATYIDKKRDMLGALRYWERAMKERHVDGWLMFPKPTAPSPVSAYDNAVEAKSLAALAALASEPDALRMQALLVRERILGPAHPDTSYYIRYRGAVYADTGHFARCVSLWMYALDMQQRMLEPLSPLTQSSLLSFAELFSFMLGDGHKRLATPPSPAAPPLAFMDILEVFLRALREIETGQTHLAKLPVGSERDTSSFHRTLLIGLHLVCLLARLAEEPGLALALSPSPAETQSMKQAIYKLVRLEPKGRNDATLLHLACSKESAAVGRYPVCVFPSPEAARLLLEVGANPNAQDTTGARPIHIAAHCRPVRAAVVQVLLDGGAHLDCVDGDGNTFEDLLPEPKQKSLLEVVNPLKHTTLQCLAARVVRRHNIPYRNIVSSALELFVTTH